jgi:hypothetical protein
MFQSRFLFFFRFRENYIYCLFPGDVNGSFQIIGSPLAPITSPHVGWISEMRLLYNIWLPAAPDPELLLGVLKITGWW